MAERTVRELLDGMHRGHWSVEQVAADFRSRSWPEPKGRPSQAEAFGVQDSPDGDVIDPDSFMAVYADMYRLTDAQYQMLFDAYREAIGR